MLPTKVKVEIEDANGKAVGSFFVNKFTVGSKIRQSEMISKIIKQDISDIAKNQQCACASIACTVTDSKGVLLYPDETGASDVMENIDADVFDILCVAFSEINPLTGSTLTAKKRKS